MSIECPECFVDNPGDMSTHVGPFRCDFCGWGSNDDDDVDPELVAYLANLDRIEGIQWSPVQFNRRFKLKRKLGSFRDKIRFGRW